MASTKRPVSSLEKEDDCDRSEQELDPKTVKKRHCRVLKKKRKKDADDVDVGTGGRKRQK